MIEPKKLLNFRKEEIRQHEAKYEMLWKIPQALPYFEGHFPNNPVLPAVAILDVSLEFLRLILNRDEIYIQSIPNTKISELMTPGLEIQLEAQAMGDRWSIHWKTREGKAIADLLIKL